MKFIPHAYQAKAIDHILTHPSCGLFMDMGLGKTVCTLTAIDRLVNDSFQVSRVLVIAPKRVALCTWADEISKWDHLSNLTLSVAIGTAEQRIAALQAKTDICVINRENVVWLVEQYRGRLLPFDMLVVDELSSFKSSTAKRFKALKKALGCFDRVVGLTGTPAPNGLIDLWPQLYLLDGGERLGKTISSYRATYFTPGQSNGFVVFNYRLRTGAEKAITQRISDICLSMKSADYLNLPQRLDHVIRVPLTEDQRAQYKDFERTQVLAFPDALASAVNAAVLSNKLLQWANGAVYDDDHLSHEVHIAKLEALEEILDTTTSPVLLFYSYKHDLARIARFFDKLDPIELKSKEDIQKWNEGKIRLLLAHPASAGHGLNLQAGGSTIVWYGLPWSLELYQQANARLHRQGQTRPVIIHHLLADGTMDGDVYRALQKKDKGQSALMDALKARVQLYR